MYQPGAIPQPVAQPVVVQYQPQHAGGSPVGPQCASCKQPCVGSYFKCSTCARHNVTDYLLCATCHRRETSKQSGGMFNIKGIVNGINRDIGNVAHMADRNIPHQSYHEYHRVDPVMTPVMQPQQGYVQPPYNPNMPYSNAVPYAGYGQPVQGAYGQPPQGYAPQGYAPQNYSAPPYGSPMGPPPSYTSNSPTASAPSAPNVGEFAPNAGYGVPQQGYAPQGFETLPQGYQVQAATPVYTPPGQYVPPVAQTVVAAPPANRVRMTFACQQLPVAFMAVQRPSACVMVLSGKTELGRTETIPNTSEPVFQTPVIVNNTESKLTFSIYDGATGAGAMLKDVSLKDIMAAPSWTGRLNDPKTGYRLPTGSLVINWTAVV